MKSGWFVKRLALLYSAGQLIEGEEDAAIVIRGHPVHSWKVTAPPPNDRGAE